MEFWLYYVIWSSVCHHFIIGVNAWVMRDDQRRLTVLEERRILDAHNAFRRREGGANMELMKWDDDLAHMANEWADTCEQSHGQPDNALLSGSIGQNIWIHADFSITNPANMIRIWQSEKAYFDHKTNRCTSEDCTHYLQVVWAVSSRVGCGISYCSPIVIEQRQSWRNAWMMVCNYIPMANLDGLPPYIRGPGCTRCAEGKNWCLGGLCTTKEIAPNAVCNLDCGGCGTLDRDKCQCHCLDGWSGPRCSVPCIDKHYLCNRAWHKIHCKIALVDDYCPMMCGLCPPIDEAHPCLRNTAEADEVPEEEEEEIQVPEKEVQEIKVPEEQTPEAYEPTTRKATLFTSALTYMKSASTTIWKQITQTPWLTTAEVDGVANSASKSAPTAQSFTKLNDVVVDNETELPNSGSKPVPTAQSFTKLDDTDAPSVNVTTPGEESTTGNGDGTPPKTTIEQKILTENEAQLDEKRSTVPVIATSGENTTPDVTTTKEQQATPEPVVLPDVTTTKEQQATPEPVVLPDVTTTKEQQTTSEPVDLSDINKTTTAESTNITTVGKEKTTVVTTDINELTQDQGITSLPFTSSMPTFADFVTRTTTRAAKPINVPIFTRIDHSEEDDKEPEKTSNDKSSHVVMSSGSLSIPISFTFG